MNPDREKEVRDLAKKNTAQGKLAKELVEWYDDREDYVNFRAAVERDKKEAAEAKIEDMESRDFLVVTEMLRLVVDDLAALSRDTHTDVILAEYEDQARRNLGL